MRGFQVSTPKQLGMLTRSLTPILIIIFFIALIGEVHSQVIFTQTTDADFSPGYLDNVLVSGNNVYLATKATDINNWLSTTDLPQTLIGHQTSRWKNYIYLSGGYNGTDYSNAVYRAGLNGTGNGGWTTYDTLPEPLTNQAMVTGLNYMYIIGGRTNGLPSDKIYFAEIISDGTLGPWTLSTVTLPQPLWGHKAHFQNGFIYVVGGTNTETETSAVNSVYYTKKAGLGGELTTFSSGIALPDARNGHAMTFYNDQLIVSGGYDNTGTKQATVYYSSVNLDGTNSGWGSLTMLTEAVSNHSSTCYNGLITIIGGETTLGLSDKIYYADADNLAPLTWNLDTDLLYEARKNGNAYTYNGVVTFAGGENISGLPIHNTRYATVNLVSEKIHAGSFLSYPFLQLGEERNIVSLSYNITYNATYNNYQLIYRTAGNNQLWGNWIEMDQDNPALIGETKQYIQYLVQYDGLNDDNIVLHDMSVNISGYTQLSGNLNGIDTLKLENSPYWATGDITFTGGTHVIEAGVEIYFSPNTGLEIEQANMAFEGTMAEPILLTSYSDEAGLWNGVHFNTNSDNGVSSQMDYVTIEKAGNGSWNSNLYCYNTNEPQINNCTFSYAEGHGILLYNADLSIDNVETSNNVENGIYNRDSSPSLSNTNMLSNGNAGIYLYDLTSNPNFFNCNLTDNLYGIFYPTPNQSFPVISGIISYDNIVSGIAMAGGDITADQTWPYNPLGYAVLGDIRIIKKNDHVRLTIAPGNTIYCDSLVHFEVGTYIHYANNYGGEIYAVGTVDSLITFTSIDGEIGGWDGIFFHYNSDSFGSESELKNCNINNARSYNVRIHESLQPRIDSCIITNAGLYDIYVQDPNSVPHITSSTSTVYVNGGTQSINKTWHNYGGDYIILTDYIIGKKNDTVRLTIEPGNNIFIDTSAMIQVGNYIHYANDYGGEIYAEGKPDSLITFTSKNGLVGGWDGFYFHYNSDSFGSNSSFSYCTIEKGNNYNIRSDGSAEPRIDNCTITNSDGYDIYATAPNDVQHITNTNSTIYIGAGIQSINKTWYNFGGDYIVLGDVIVGGVKNAYNTLSIQPGNTIKFDTTMQLQIGQYIHYANNYGGEIIAEGTPDSLIIFQPRDNINGDWDGIYFHDLADNYGGNSSFNYCIVEGSKGNNLYLHTTNNVSFQHATFTDSKLAGIRLHNSSPYLELCQLINNDSIGLLLTGSSNPIVGDTLGSGCDLYGNGDFEIYNSTGNLIHAKNNFWNTTDSTTIAGRVYDHYDNGSYGIVDFMPVATNSFFNNLPPDEFNLLSLTDNFVTTDQTPSFTWEIPTEPDGDEVSYYFYYTDDESWATNITVSEELTDANYTIPEILIGGKAYWWRVKAKDGYLARSSNQIWAFTVSLRPGIPSPIVPSNGTLMRDDDYIVWLTTTDPDEGDYVSHYHLQIDDDPGFSSPEIDTNGIMVNGKTSSLSMQISGLPGYMDLRNKNYYWRVSAIDGFGIESDFSDGTNYFLYMLDVSMKVLLEGPFMGSGMEATLNTKDLLPLTQPYNVSPWNYMEFEGVESIPNIDIIDWILLEFRSTIGDAASATLDKTIFRQVAFVLNDGSIIDLDGMSIFEFPISFDDNTYLVIHHRNHLSIISELPLLPEMGEYYYDFSTGADRVLGGVSGYSEISPGVWGMASGDANADGFVNLIDKTTEWNENVGEPGYLGTDFNMDGEVDNPDKNEKWLYNSGKSSHVPD